MTYNELLKKGTTQLIKAQLQQGKSYSQATVAVKKQIIEARNHAYDEAEYHNVNAQAWGDGDGDDGLMAQYGSYDAIVEQKEAAENAASSLSALKVGLQANYALKCMETIQDFPKRGPREDNEEYAKKLDVYVENLNDIQQEAEQVKTWTCRLSTVEANGYDADDKSDYYQFRKNLAECLEQLNNLPYEDLATAQDVLQDCARGLKKAEEKKAEMQGTFGN